MTGRQLKAFRKKFGQTQGELADMLGVARNTVTRWESDNPEVHLPVPGYLHLALAELSRRLESLPAKPKKKTGSKT